MKKRGLVLSVTAIAVAAGLMAGCTNKQAAATAQTEAAADTFNPDKEAGVSIEELREKLGMFRSRTVRLNWEQWQNPLIMSTGEP